jgi:hypothetical protein
MGQGRLAGIRNEEGNSWVEVRSLEADTTLRVLEGRIGAQEVKHWGHLNHGQIT